MCAECRDITLHITDIHDENRQDKFVKSVAELAKALRVPAKLKTSAAQREVPLKVVEESEKEFKEHMRKLFQEIVVLVAKKLGLLLKAAVPFKLAGKFIIDPETGQVLTQGQWKRFKRALDKYLEGRTEGLAEKLVAKQTALGIITQRMSARGIDPEKLTPRDIRQRLPKSTKAVQKLLKDKALQNRPVFNTMRTATYVTSTVEKVRNDILRTVNEGLSNRVPKKELARQLFELDGDWNRDWERIVETESQDAFNDGYLAGEIDQEDPEVDIYMIGASAGNACPICQRDVTGKVVKLLSEAPPDGDERIRDQHTNLAIWPGKTSVGHPNREPWSSITRHPWCRCRWVRIFPEDITEEQRRQLR